MNERFSKYLTKIGLLNDKKNSSNIFKSISKSNGQNFENYSFNLLMIFFNNLNEEQKKYMCHSIPSNYKIISEEKRREKIKSLIFQLKLKHEMVLLKHFYRWKLNISLLKAFLKTENDIDYNISNYRDNIALYNLINIDNNIDVDNKNKTQTEEAEEQKNKINQEQNQNQLSKKSLSFADYKFKMSNQSKENFTKINNNKKIERKASNSRNKKKSYNNNKLNKSKMEINPYNFRNNKIKQNMTQQLSVNSYKNIRNKNKKNYSTSKNSNDNTKNNNTSIKSHLLTSLEEKELLELEECIFKPKINNMRKYLKNYSSKNIVNSSMNTQKRKEEIQSRFEKLYRDNEKYKLSRQLKAIEQENAQNRKMTFIPQLKTQFREYLNKYKLKSEGNFEERQQKYLIRKNKHSNEIKNEIDSLYDSICSFNPKITNSKGEYYQFKNTQKFNNKPVFLRLYEDGKDRRKYQAMAETEKINKIMDMSNILNPNKNFDYDLIDRLYENREQKTNMILTKKKVEEEEGTTFKPYISENYYSRSVNGTFYERNQKFLNDKESFYDEENKKQQNSAKKNRNRKEYSKAERKKIINNIINRLYKDSANIKKTLNNNNKVKSVKSFN